MIATGTSSRIRDRLAPLVALPALLFAWMPLSHAGLTVALGNDLQESQLDGAVVTVRPLEGTALAPREGIHRVTMEQIGRQFQPYILAVPVGVPVEFPNLDRIAHHVYSFSRVGAFEIPLYKGTTPAPIVFDRPGVVPLGCNIHDWMLGYIYVVDAPRFAELRGHEAVFDDLGPGSYEIGVWHPALADAENATWRIEVGSGDQRTVLTLPEPLLAAGQPVAPLERFDEAADY